MCYNIILFYGIIVNMKKGVYEAKLKNGTVYYRASLTSGSKHISLGSYDTADAANAAYEEGKKLLSDESITLDNISFSSYTLSFSKIIVLLNLRDNDIYIKTPIYLQKGYFMYYLSPTWILKFDNDDLFYYGSHAIQTRGNHLFVSDYGMQYSILMRYGIKNYAVAGRDYEFANGDSTDYRYSNIIIINKYNGVFKSVIKGKERYTAKIHINGDFIIGRYSSEQKAAVAYNKAADLLVANGFDKNYALNYVTEYSASEYADVYSSIKLSKKFLNYIGIIPS